MVKNDIKWIYAKATQRSDCRYESRWKQSSYRHANGKLDAIELKYKPKDISFPESKKSWEYAVKNEYTFMYKDKKVNPACIEYERYTVEFDDENHTVYLSDN